MAGMFLKKPGNLFEKTVGNDAILLKKGGFFFEMGKLEKAGNF